MLEEVWTGAELGIQTGLAGNVLGASIASKQGEISKLTHTCSRHWGSGKQSGEHRDTICQWKCPLRPRLRFDPTVSLHSPDALFLHFHLPFLPGTNCFFSYPCFRPWKLLQGEDYNPFSIPSALTLIRAATDSKAPENVLIYRAKLFWWLQNYIYQQLNTRQITAKPPSAPMGTTRGWQQHRQSCRPPLCSPALHFTGEIKGTAPAVTWDCFARSVYYTTTWLIQDRDSPTSPYASAPQFLHCFTPLDSNESPSWAGEISSRHWLIHHFINRMITV